MNSSIILVLVFGIIGFLIARPTIITLIRAKKAGANIDFSRAFGLTLRKTNSKEFLEAIAGFQKNKIDIEFENFEALNLAGGDLKNCLEGYLYGKEIGLVVDFQMVSALDLAGKNVKEALQNSKNEYYLRIVSLKSEQLSIDYSGQYRLTATSSYASNGEDVIKNRITQEIQSFLDSWKSNNPEETEKKILEEIINPKFWIEQIQATILKQDLTIRKQ